MVKTLKIALLVAGVAAAAFWMNARPSAQATGVPSTKNGDWTHYTADIRGSKYMPLDQISSPVLPSSAITERRVPAVV